MQVHEIETNLFPGMAIIDLEASGLHDGSYPIEVGWCFGNLQTASYLIRPMDSWGLRDWSHESEKIHGLSRDYCLEEGMEAENVAMRINIDLHGLHLLSDNPEYDGAWLSKLFKDTGIEPQFTIGDLYRELRNLVGVWGAQDYDNIRRQLSRIFPYTHRASDDALNMMAALCALRKPSLIDIWAEQQAASRG